MHRAVTRRLNLNLVTPLGHRGASRRRARFAGAVTHSASHRPPESLTQLTPPFFESSFSASATVLSKRDLRGEAIPNDRGGIAAEAPLHQASRAARCSGYLPRM